MNGTFIANVTDTGDVSWDHPNVPIAIGVSIGAGLSTGLGGALVFFPELMRRIPQATILAVSLALSAGVMIYVSFIEIFAKSLGAIEATPGMSEGGAVALTTTFFFLGMLFCVALEVAVHKMTGGNDGHEHVCAAHAKVPGAAQDTACTTAEVSIKVESTSTAQQQQLSSTAVPGELIGNKVEGKALARMGLMTACAIAIHNFPEGLATFLATVSDTSLGASLGVAIAVHNIPEGLCVAMPIYYATGSKWKGFWWSVLSGVTEPIGGILGFAALQPVFTDLVFGVVFSMVGGMMVFIVCHELLPAAHRYMGNPAKATAWLMLGMFIMALSLVLFVL